jgi:hypothetical protein
LSLGPPTGVAGRVRENHFYALVPEASVSPIVSGQVPEAPPGQAGRLLAFPRNLAWPGTVVAPIAPTPQQGSSTGLLFCFVPYTHSARSPNSAPAGGPNPAGEVDMRLAGGWLPQRTGGRPRCSDVCQEGPGWPLGLVLKMEDCAHKHSFCDLGQNLSPVRTSS